MNTALKESSHAKRRNKDASGEPHLSDSTALMSSNSIERMEESRSRASATPKATGTRLCACKVVVGGDLLRISTESKGLHKDTCTPGESSASPLLSRRLAFFPNHTYASAFTGLTSYDLYSFPS